MLEIEKKEDFIREFFYYDKNIVDLVILILDRCEDITNEENVIDSINDTLIYYEDLWNIAIHYNIAPSTMNWEDTINEFVSDVLICAKHYYEKN